MTKIKTGSFLALRLESRLNLRVHGGSGISCVQSSDLLFECLSDFALRILIASPWLMLDGLVAIAKLGMILLGTIR